MVSSRDHIEKFYSKEVKDVMYTHDWDLPIIEKDTTLEILLAIMEGKDRVWVVDNKKTKKLIGVITEKTLLDVIVPPRIQRYGFTTASYKSLAAGNITTVGNFMVTKVVSCTLDTTIQDAIILMQKYRVRHLPVVDKKNTLLGEIDIAYIIRGLSTCLRDINGC